MFERLPKQIKPMGVDAYFGLHYNRLRASQLITTEPANNLFEPRYRFFGLAERGKKQRAFEALAHLDNLELFDEIAAGQISLHNIDTEQAFTTLDITIEDGEVIPENHEFLRLGREMGYTALKSGFLLYPEQPNQHY